MPQGIPIRFELDVTEHDGSWVQTFRPAGDMLEWAYVMGQPGGVLFPVSLSDPNLTADVFAPKANDWQLNLVVEDVGVTELAAGVIQSVNVVGNEQLLKVSGDDWLAWLEQPYWGFDYDKTLAQRIASDSAGDYGVSWSGASGDHQDDVVLDLLATLATGFNDVVLTANLSGTGWGQGIDYGIEWGNQSSVLQHLTTISNLYQPRGFDFWTTWDQQFVAVGPRALDPSSVTPIYTLDDADVIVAYDWVNNGPASTDFVGYGPGTGNMAEYARSEYAASITQFRRWRKIMTFPPGPALTGSSTVTSRTSAQAYLERFPQKRLLLTVRPDMLDPADPTAGFQQFLGEAVDVDWTFPGYHRINSYFWVTGQRYYFRDGMPLLDLSLDQLYN